MVKFNWKKKAAKALVFAMVMGTVGVHGIALKSPVAVMAADDPASSTKASISIDYTNYTATITGTEDDSYVFLEVLKENKDDSKVSASHCYKLGEGKKVTVDLSFLKATKEQYIRAYGNATMEKSRSDISTINKQPAKVAIKYVPGQYKEGTIDLNKSFSIGADIKDYQYKTLYGSEWKDFVTADISYDIDTASVAGTTLVVRKKAVDGDVEADKAPAGVEVKVKIAANPKAPKVAIDYVKGTIKLPKDSQYAQLKEGKLSDWKDNSAAKAWTLDDLRKELGVVSTATEDGDVQEQAATSDGFTLVVRTKAGKKAASALTFVSVSETPTLKEESGAYTVTVGETTAKLTYKNTTKGIELKAENSPFEYYDSAKSAWKTVAAGKTVEVKLENGAPLEVRAAGVKPSKTVLVGSFASGKETLTCDIVPAKVTVTAGKVELTKDETTTAKAEAVDGNKKTIDDKKYSEDSNIAWKWTSSNDAVATVEDGKIKAVAAGKATITAELNGIKGTIEITVTAADDTQKE